ncbi:hypothetical protein AOLI_G00292420 [Acnodon oligacanthus]
MIDLSYLTEEEQEMIMTVLKRDEELKKAEEERIKQLQKVGPEQGKLKYMTGEWFYEAKSQRHQDRIHGSDIIMASMKQKKPMTVEFLTQSWRERSSKSNDTMTANPGTSDSLKSGTSEAQQDRISLGMRSPSRPRHNPFNTVPINLDLEELNSQLPNGAPGPKAKKASVRETLPPLKTREATKTETKNKVSDTLQELAPRQKPVPKKRTKLYKLNSVSDNTNSVSTRSVSTSSGVRSPVSTQSVSISSSITSPMSTPSVSTISDSTSTVSTQSVSVSSDLRSPPPRGILKHSSSCSSSDSNIKSQLPQSLNRLSSIPTNSALEQAFEEDAITKERTPSPLNTKDEEPLSSSSPLKSAVPKSRLPVRSPVPLNSSEQKAQEKPKIQPRLSLTSSNRSDDEHKSTGIMHTDTQKHENNNTHNWLTSAEPENQITFNGTKHKPLSIPGPTAKSTLEAPLDNSLNESTVPQISQYKLKEEGHKLPKNENEKTQEQQYDPQSNVDQHEYEAFNRVETSQKVEAPCPVSSSQIADANLEPESGYSPPTFNIKTKPNIKTDDYKHSLMVDSNAPNPSEEQGDSIAKVLEWFSRSSDSSDKLDSEGSVREDMEDGTKIEDIDFEDEINLRAKPEDNVYLIIPKQNNEKTSKNVKEGDRWEELSVDEPEPLRKTQDVRQERFEPKPSRLEPLPVPGSSTYMSFQPDNVTHRKMDISEKASSGNKCIEEASKNEERSNVDRLKGTESKLTQHQLKETIDHDENQPPKIANLKSFWERGNTGPKILVSRSSMNSEKENKHVNQDNAGKKMIDDIEEPPSVELNSKANYAVAETKEQASVKEGLNVDDSKNIVSTGPNDESKQETIIKDMQPPWSFANHKKDIVVLNSPSDTDVTPLMHLKSSSPSLDNGSFVDGQGNENVRGTMSVNSSEGDRMSPALLELDHRTKTEESEARPGSPPKSSTYMQQQNPVPLAKQSGQQQDNRAERIKQLKLFWEKEKWEPRIYVRSSAADDTKSSGTSSSKLNKRFTKSEFDLRSIGTELDDEFEDRGRQSPNFAFLPLRDKSVTAEGMNSSQFKALRDFWAGSSAKHKPLLESQRPLSPEVKLLSPKAELHSPVDAKLYLNQNLYPNQSDKTNFTGLGNDVGSTKPPRTDRAFQSSSKERTSATRPDPDYKANFFYKPSGEPDLLRSSNSPQPRRGSQSSLKDTVPPKPPGMLNKESRQQARRSSKGLLNGRGNSLRRATSMFTVNIDDEDQLHLQSKKAPDINLPQLKKATEVNMPPSKKSPEPSLQVKKSPEITKNKEKISERRPSRTSEDSDSQPLARSFVPRDYQHYLGITENKGIFTPPQVTEQMSEIVCTPFEMSPDTGRSLRCSPVQASTPAGSAELRARRGSLGQHHNTHSSEDLDHDTLHTVDTWSHSRASSDRVEESPVQGALRRAAARPIYHKSLEDITAIPRPTRKSNQMDDSMPNSYDNSSTPSPPSSSFSDPEHLRKLSKSVPSFLQKENDGGESDSTSEYSSHSGMHWQNSRPRTNLRSNSASASSVSGSVISVYSGDFTSVEVQGTIQFSLNYVQKLREFHIFVVQCKNLAAVDPKRNRSDPYVKSYLIPDSSNLGKRKTSVKKRTLNPTYNEILRYRVRMEYLKTQILNLSVWHNDTFGRNSFLGEIEIDLSTWDFGNTKINSLSLKSRNTSGLQPAEDRGEMRLAMRFLPQLSHSNTVPNSGEVHIWVKDCKNLPLIRGAAIDPFVKCFVLPDTSKKSRQKTRVLKRTTNPVFNHTMVYDGFRAEDLKEACVELTVWDRDRLANHLLGGLRLSLGTGKSYGVKVDWMDSTAEEAALWERMMESPNEWVEDVLPLRMVTTAKSTWK